MTRGFKYDELTEADDVKVEAVRDRLYAAPCGAGVWVSVKTGTIFEGNGGNEREQWHWQQIGPWVRVAELDVRALFSQEWELLRVTEQRLADIQTFVAGSDQP